MSLTTRTRGRGLLSKHTGGKRAALWGWGALGVLTLVFLWELYKFLGPAEGLIIGGMRVLPRTTDLAMPHIWNMFAVLGEQVTPATPQTIWFTVLSSALVTLGLAAAGFAVGLSVGSTLALVMLRWRIAEWGILPWVILSQTVPLIAFAPVVKLWGAGLGIGMVWNWIAVAIIASYLAFFPITVGVLRGLQSPDTIHLELLRSYGVGWWRTLRVLRIPAAVPYVLPALRLGAANAVVGAVVAEVSTSLEGGIGRILITWAGQASGNPAKPWGPIFGAIALGLVAAGSVALLGIILRNYRRVEVSA